MDGRKEYSGVWCGRGEAQAENIEKQGTQKWKCRKETLCTLRNCSSKVLKATRNSSTLKSGERCSNVSSPGTCGLDVAPERDGGVKMAMVASGTCIEEHRGEGVRRRLNATVDEYDGRF